MYKVCVYAICKNEEKYVDRWMDSMSEADAVIVTDTGSDDVTVEKLKKRGAIVYSSNITPWRFDAARNASLDHVPEDTDICVCTDLDEVFLPGWRDCLEKAWSKAGECGAKTGHYLYNWRLKPDGTPDVQFNNFKAHERKGFRWKYPVHEILEYTGAGKTCPIFIDGMVLNHFPDANKPRSQYMSLLEMAVAESPNDARMLFYLGREYMFFRRWKECIPTLVRYVGLSRWDEECAQAMGFIAEAYFMLGNSTEAYVWYLRAIALTPHIREHYVQLALLMYRLEDWPMVLLFIKEALKITKKSDSYINEGYAWDKTPYIMLATAMNRLSGKPDLLKA